MRVVLYTHHSLFEPALSLAAALSGKVELHLLLELPAGTWKTANFEAEGDDLPSGVVAADELLAPFFPERTRRMWQQAASFHLVVTSPRRARGRESRRLMGQVLDWIRDLEPDLVHLDDVDVSPRLALAMACRRTPFPLLVGCHDPDPHSGEQQWRTKRLVRALMLPRADAFLVHHQAGALGFHRRHPRTHAPVYVVRLASYGFLSHHQATLAAAPAAPMVLLFGRMTPYKGLEDLFRAAPHVARAVPGVRFVVAGAPVTGYQPPPTPVLPNGGRVETRYEYVSTADAADLFARARVAVCPYTDASQSGVVLTAYAFGCPVVVTDVGGLPEYVEDGRTGLVVPPGDSVALAATLVRCLGDPELVASMRAGVASANTSSLGWARVATELLDVYSAVAREARQRRRRRPVEAHR